MNIYILTICRYLYFYIAQNHMYFVTAYDVLTIDTLNFGCSILKQISYSNYKNSTGSHDLAQWISENSKMYTTVVDLIL